MTTSHSANHRWNPPTDLNRQNAVPMIIDVFDLMAAWVDYALIYDLDKLWMLDYWGDRYVLVRKDSDNATTVSEEGGSKNPPLWGKSPLGRRYGSR